MDSKYWQILDTYGKKKRKQQIEKIDIVNDNLKEANQQKIKAKMMTINNNVIDLLENSDSDNDDNKKGHNPAAIDKEHKRQKNKNVQEVVEEEDKILEEHRKNTLIDQDLLLRKIQSEIDNDADQMALRQSQLIESVVRPNENSTKGFTFDSFRLRLKDSTISTALNNSKITQQVNCLTNYPIKSRKFKPEQQVIIKLNKEQERELKIQSMRRSQQNQNLCPSSTQSIGHSNLPIVNPMPLSINRHTNSINNLLWSEGPGNQIQISKDKGDSHGFIPGILKFQIPTFGKHSLKMQILRSVHYEVVVGITVKKATLCVWTAIIKFPHLAFKVNECGIIEGGSNHTYRKFVQTNIAKVYLHTEMEVDMDQKVVIWRFSNRAIPKSNTNTFSAETKFPINDQLINEAIKSEQSTSDQYGLVPFVAFRFNYDKVRLYQ